MDDKRERIEYVKGLCMGGSDAYAIPARPSIQKLKKKKRVLHDETRLLLHRIRKLHENRDETDHIIRNVR